MRNDCARSRAAIWARRPTEEKPATGGNALRGLKGKIAAVTGAGSGIGQAAAKRLAEEGCSVAILEWKEAAANDTLTQIKAAGGEAAAILVDVGNEPQVEAAFKRVLEVYGRLDI